VHLGFVLRLGRSVLAAVTTLGGLVRREHRLVGCAVGGLLSLLVSHNCHLLPMLEIVHADTA
jgi:hypothetical protein